MPKVMTANDGNTTSHDDSDKATAELFVARAKEMWHTSTTTTNDDDAPKAITAPEIWSILHQSILTPEIPFTIHRWCYDLVYAMTDTNQNQNDHHSVHQLYHEQPLKPCWLPPSTTTTTTITNIERMMQQQGFTTYQEFYQWSIHHTNDFWMSSIDAIQIQWSTRPERAFQIPNANQNHNSNHNEEVDVNSCYYTPSYFPGGRLNIADSCLRTKDVTDDSEPDAAIIFANDTNPTLLQIWTNTELRTLSFKVAHQIQHVLQLPTHTNIAICMPMIPESIAIYLGIILSGCVVVSIADSFSVTEIATRCRIAQVQAAFTQDVVYRNDTAIPLATRIWDAEQENNRTAVKVGNDTNHPVMVEKESKTDGDESNGTTGNHGHIKVVVVPATLHMGSYDDQSKDTTTLHETIQLRPGLDWSWNDFLWNKAVASVFDETQAESFPCDSMDPCNILFSSGTTGEPKAVVWSHSTPIKCGIDGYYHQDITSVDRVAWPTNIGWMMGPWLLFQRIHGATICLFQGLPHTKHFCKFIEVSKVTMLGVIPSLVKAWYDRSSIDGSDWSHIRRFSSTGEASDEETYHWLMSRVPGYAPIIEYCGGTEIGGSFLSSTMIQPNIPILGSKISLLDPDTNQIISASEYTFGPSGSTAGELVLHPPSVGLSTVLLNRNHFDCYFAGMPTDSNGRLLRRHGDAIEVVRDKDDSLPYFRALGRCDDTMNIGGIKVSSVEIERVCNTVSIVKETAAIAVTASGGPCKLIVFAVLHNDADAINSLSPSELKIAMQQAIKIGLNPLFGIYDVIITDALPRTASNKIMRRLLRDNYVASTLL